MLPVGVVAALLGLAGCCVPSGDTHRVAGWDSGPAPRVSLSALRKGVDHQFDPILGVIMGRAGFEGANMAPEEGAAARARDAEWARQGATAGTVQALLCWSAFPADEDTAMRLCRSREMNPDATYYRPVARADLRALVETARLRSAAAAAAVNQARQAGLRALAAGSGLPGEADFDLGDAEAMAQASARDRASGQAPDLYQIYLRDERTRRIVRAFGAAFLDQGGKRFFHPPALSAGLGPEWVDYELSALADRVRLVARWFHETGGLSLEGYSALCQQVEDGLWGPERVAGPAVVAPLQFRHEGPWRLPPVVAKQTAAILQARADCLGLAVEVTCDGGQLAVDQRQSAKAEDLAWLTRTGDLVLRSVATPINTPVELLQVDHARLAQWLEGGGWDLVRADPRNIQQFLAHPMRQGADGGRPPFDWIACVHHPCPSSDRKTWPARLGASGIPFVMPVYTRDEYNLGQVPTEGRASGTAALLELIPVCRGGANGECDWRPASVTVHRNHPRVFPLAIDARMVAADTDRFLDWTGARSGRLGAIILDDQLVGTFVITLCIAEPLRLFVDKVDRADGDRLAAVLENGALPVRLR